jgi:hypothetical protein
MEESGILYAFLSRPLRVLLKFINFRLRSGS